MRRPSRPVHRSQTLIRKIPNEIKVPHFGFRNTLLYGLGVALGGFDGQLRLKPKRQSARLSKAIHDLAILS